MTATPTPGDLSARLRLEVETALRVARNLEDGVERVMTAIAALSALPAAGGAVCADAVLVPRELDSSAVQFLANFDMDEVGNNRYDAASECWGELLDMAAAPAPMLEFSNPVFKPGRNTTVRRGEKWYAKQHARVAVGETILTVRLHTMTHKFSRLDDHWLRDEHDPSCRTVSGLLAEMQRVYPGFSPSETVTLVDFYLPDYTTPQPSAAEGAAVGEDAVLPCDVVVAPATRIRKGCKVSTLLHCIDTRRSAEPIPDVDAEAFGALLGDVRASFYADTCEGGSPDCGPVAHFDEDGVPLCQRCWDGLIADEGRATPPPGAAVGAQGEVLEMRLCEVPYVILHRDRLYRFTVDPNCEKCRDAASTYGATPAAGKGVDDAARALVERLHAVHAHPEYQAVWYSGHNHRGPYTGPKYEAELAAIEAALTRQPVAGGGWVERVRAWANTLQSADRTTLHLLLDELATPADTPTDGGEG